MEDVFHMGPGTLRQVTVRTSARCGEGNTVIRYAHAHVDRHRISRKKLHGGIRERLVQRMQEALQEEGKRGIILLRVGLAQ